MDNEDDLDRAPATPPPGAQPPPWEDRSRYGFINAVYLTTREVLLAPGLFFARPISQPGLWQPLLFAMVIGAVSAFFDWMWMLAGSSLRVLVGQDIARLMRAQFLSGMAFLLSPVLVFAGVFLRAAVVHVCLLIVDAARGGFAATFRVVAYSEAVWILAVLPFCGNLFAVVWGTIVAIVGVRELHRCESWRAVVGVLLPLLICLSSCGGLTMLAITRGLLD
mgnify:CR=1 FL=1